jgi:hypothetical protein
MTAAELKVGDRFRLGTRSRRVFTVRRFFWAKDARLCPLVRRGDVVVICGCNASLTLAPDRVIIPVA